MVKSISVLKACSAAFDEDGPDTRRSESIDSPSTTGFAARLVDISNVGVGSGRNTKIALIGVKS